MKDSNTSKSPKQIQLEVQLAKLTQRLAQPGLSAANKLLVTKLAKRIEEELQKLESSAGSRSASNASMTSEVPTTPTPQSPTPIASTIPPILSTSTSPATLAPTPKSSIVYNAEQLQAIQWALEGKSFVLTGPAGSGKTTTFRGIIDALTESGRLGVLSAQGHKHLRDGTPGCVLISFTNKAVENVKKRLPHDLHLNCITSHKFLEYEPVFEETFNKETGETTKTRTFEPQRTSSRPNPMSIRSLNIDEATMTDVPMWNRIIESLPRRTEPDLQVILIGDINQLPPIFGKSIFIHALQQNMRRVVLTQIYRQALDNPILALAHRILSGKVIPAPQLKEWNIDKLAEGQGKLTVMPWKKKLTDTAANVFMRNKLPQFIDAGMFDPAEDVIITPTNGQKVYQFGTELLNNIVASHYAKKLNAEVWEIYTGQRKVYMRVGERVLYKKSEAIVTSIRPNAQYFGRPPRKPSNTMNYEGIESDKSKAMELASSVATDEDVTSYVDRLLEHMGSHVDEDAPARRAASHIVTVRSVDSGEETTISSAGDINALALGYAITVHKTQGSEYRRVFFITHHTQSVMFVRELLYVAVTRAKEELVVICEPNLFVQGITTQKLPGKTVEEKIEAFERAIKLEGRRGDGNLDQIPKDLHRFLD